MANTFGTIALTYSAIGVALSFVQEDNDDINTMTSAGALYGGLSKPNKTASQSLWKLRAKRAGIGSLIGILAASGYILLFNRDKYLANNRY
ncbi:hypothetical protein BLA29_009998 [Euroglyphus maynei]|uniref:Uncharacterized protein n=1 Tax=Euroglyphus maynei TaxID=6958 RepID=A0A1Y3BMS2_EURMA|nr:hypothetical protein BLA29_009998 [Euroglyphus maynei]